jgi:hypothetical protein
LAFAHAIWIKIKCSQGGYGPLELPRKDKNARYTKEIIANIRKKS